MKEILSKMFSYRGEFNRKDYLLFGLLIPIGIIIFFGIFAAILVPKLGESNPLSFIFVLIIILMYSIFLSSAIKRARNTAASTFLTMVLYFFLTPVAILYLLFAPAKKKDTQTKENLN